MELDTLFNKQDSDEFYPPKDEYQRKYRQAFEGVVDKYLIHHCDDENAKILIYIDPENDIDWIMMKDPLNQYCVKLIFNRL